jgi:hypothetical protein
MFSTDDDNDPAKDAGLLTTTFDMFVVGIAAAVPPSKEASIIAHKHRVQESKLNGVM